MTFHLFEMRNWFRLFFIPVVPGRARHAVICPVCQYGIEITGAALDAARELIGLTAEQRTGGTDPASYRRKIDAFWSMLGGERLADPHDARPARSPAEPGAHPLDPPPPDPAAPTPNPPAGWYADPFGESEQRYWDGERWTAGTNPPRLRN